MSYKNDLIKILDKYNITYNIHKNIINFNNIYINFSKSMYDIFEHISSLYYIPQMNNIVYDNILNVTLTHYENEIINQSDFQLFIKLNNIIINRKEHILVRNKLIPIKRVVLFNNHIIELEEDISDILSNRNICINEYHIPIKKYIQSVYIKNGIHPNVDISGKKTFCWTTFEKPQLLCKKTIDLLEYAMSTANLTHKHNGFDNKEILCYISKYNLTKGGF